MPTICLGSVLISVDLNDANTRVRVLHEFGGDNTPSAGDLRRTLYAPGACGFRALYAPGAGSAPSGDGHTSHFDHIRGALLGRKQGANGNQVAVAMPGRIQAR
jgi:hypothetical protein